MTVEPELAAATAAVNAGMAASDANLRWTEQMQATIAGSEVAVQPASTPDDIAVDWPGGGPAPASDLPLPQKVTRPSDHQPS